MDKENIHSTVDDLARRTQQSVERARTAAHSMTDQAAGTATAEPGMLDNVTEKARNVAHTVGEKARDVASTVTEAAEQAREKVAHYASAAGSQVAHAKEAACEWTSQATDQAGHYLREAGDETTAMIRRYPIPALLVGFGVGVLLARLTTSNRA